MYSAFERIPVEKQEAILQVCIEEFSKHGYDKTTTDTITQRAGISKGLLFHYFKSKKQLFLYVVKHVYQLLYSVNIKRLREIQTKDFFDHIKELLQLKGQVTMEYFKETQLMMHAFLNPPAAAKKELMDMLQEHMQNYHESLADEVVYKIELIDKARLREGVTSARVINMAKFIVDQLRNKYLMSLSDAEQLTRDYLIAMGQELEDYLEIMKHGVYKN